MNTPFATYASSWQENQPLEQQQPEARSIRGEKPVDLAPSPKPQPKHLKITADRWKSAAGDFVSYRERRTISHKHKFNIADSAKALLTDRVKVALDNLLPVVYNVADQYFVSIKQIEIIGHVFLDEDAQEVVVRVWVALPEAAALTFWDFLGRAIELRISYLPSVVADVAIDRISFEVESVKNV